MGNHMSIGLQNRLNISCQKHISSWYSIYRPRPDERLSSRSKYFAKKITCQKVVRPGLETGMNGLRAYDDQANMSHACIRACFCQKL